MIKSDDFELKRKGSREIDPVPHPDSSDETDEAASEKGFHREYSVPLSPLMVKKKSS